MPAANRQFGASGGAVSWDTSQDFGNSPPVRTLPIPPPDAKLLKRYLQAEYSVAKNELKFENYLQTENIWNLEKNLEHIQMPIY